MGWTVSYERASLDRNGDSATVERQRKENTQQAELIGKTIEKFYRDNSVSAFDESKKRDDFGKLIRDVEDGKISTIIVWHFDRLCVRIRDLARLLDAGRKHGVMIKSVHGISIDTSDPTGVAVATILTAVAEMERAHKGTRHRAANRQRAERGLVRWTRRPFGYDVHDDKAKTIYVVEDEARVLRWCARRVIESKPDRVNLARLCRVLDRIGCADRTWNTPRLRRLLLSPRHAGRSVLNGQDYGEAAFPAIFDDETHEALKVRLNDPKRRTNTGTGHRHLLSGIIVCSKCDKAMYCQPDKTHSGTARLVYKCRKGHLTRLTEPVDALVTSAVLDVVSQPGAASALVPDVDLDALAGQAGELRQRRDAIGAMVADGLLSVNAGREQASKLTDQLDEIEREIESMSGTSPATVLASADDAVTAWNELDLMTKREIIRSLVTVTCLKSTPGPFDPNSIEIKQR